MTTLDPVQTAARSPRLLREAPSTVDLPRRSALGASSYVTAPGAVPVRIGSYRRSSRPARPVRVVADVTYSDFFAAPGA
jgi:hypothetical protein